MVHLRLLALVLATGCSSSAEPARTPPPAAPPSPTPAPAPRVAPNDDEQASDDGFDVTTWQALLSEHATADGGFRYAALHADDEARARLATVVQAIADAEPDAWSRDAQLAFYIDAYNALVVHQVLSRWPIESVMRVEGFFDAQTFEVAGEAMTLNALENDVIRARFEEPRIHFAVNCASVGCPRLSVTAYTAENIEAQLAAQSAEFVRGTSRVEGRALHVSQIFEWFADDFGGVDGVRAFLAERLEGDAAERALSGRLRYDDYDWDLNDRP